MKVYTIDEYCAKYEMSESTLRRKIKAGFIPAYHEIKHLDKRGFVIIDWR